jgi:hypothetical protein
MQLLAISTAFAAIYSLAFSPPAGAWLLMENL